MRQCPHCRSAERQVESGSNRTGTQRLQCQQCQSCRRQYTPEPNPLGYDDKVGEAALKLYLEGNESQTYSVEGDNAEFRHYPARLTRRSRCFSKCIEALRRAVEPFVWCWNWRQARKLRRPRYPVHLIDAVSCLI